MLITDVTDGVHLLQHGNVNCWLIEDQDGDGLTLVDAGLPGAWRHLTEGVQSLGHRMEDIRALVLTHAHFDHVGMARRLVRQLGLPVYAHSADHELAAHPFRYAHENPIAPYPLRHPRAVPLLGSMLAAGMPFVRGLDDVRPLQVDAELDVPGRPRVIATPGHTHGHVALHLPERDAVITGDALVTLDPYTARRGPRLVAGAATADESRALASLDAIAETDARRVLPGHGMPWTRGARTAAELARKNGMA
ncbi:MBL fold metallo-hydrolase [Corynebacterium guangdongense]|uniref:Glyoxylase-like metal-dependent hydrolase (Beta-lactamase superfamily II) n=1 Tax=Corynebacterium guangdongense TaxID=1783348 RepID=A0ABU1ZZG4_9CORY|nr:MBL fold metallo-hydrolase [Corynebacterium guangdongense]MDR7330250.1 glyoxylase-like metal-dependent hydrolase (beta-lactamase superfamily II) [Corynebacterium guangdongense]WJZ18808.1 putative metallo-hydrolase YflN [Corynebacterium guangdongense]